jgi:hypothetical protein
MSLNVLDAHFEAGVDNTPAEALRYVMSLPAATVVSGMPSRAVLEQHLAIARDFTPLIWSIVTAIRAAR